MNQPGVDPSATREERQGVYFFHIPKTSGMSIWHYLDLNYPRDRICPLWLWDQLINVPYRDLDTWDVFRGHFLSHLQPYLRRSLVTFTMLRDPLDRTISHYHHVQRDPDHPFHRAVLDMSLREFCVDPLTCHMVKNYQSGFLAKSACDPSAGLRKFSAEAFARFELQQQMEFPDPLNDDEVLFALAMERLTSFAAVGFTEDFSRSLARIASVLSLPEPPVLAPQNVNPAKGRLAKIDTATTNLIRDLTSVDERLYQFALVHFDAEFECPVDRRK